MCFAYSLIGTNKSSERNGFRSRKRGVPTCSMLHSLDGFSPLVFVFVRRAMLNKLLASLRVLPLAQLGEVFGSDGTGQAIFRGESTLPFALNGVAF